MIQVGLTGWGDHDDLYDKGTPSRNKLRVYSRHFPLVEVDSSFYAIQSPGNYQKWVDMTPNDFSFVVKAYQGMTGHLRGRQTFASRAEMFQTFLESIQPVIRAGKLKAILFQFPPWFECSKRNVDLLRYVKDQMGANPAALEFRHMSWFSSAMRDKTLAFMEREGWIHSICDEPQAGSGSVPTVLHPTHPDYCLVRFHGRNVQGWLDKGNPHWRDVRYLYRYSVEELLQWRENIQYLQQASKEIGLLFNNNSGGDACANAKQMIEILGIRYEPGDREPEQLDLFDQRED